MNAEIRVKIKVKDFMEGKFVTILMSLVTVFALVGVSSLSPSLLDSVLIFIMLVALG